MSNQTIQQTLSRRRFLEMGAIAATSALVLPKANAQEGNQPDSNFNGVQIGTITYSYRGMPGSAEDLLGYILQCGISSVELMGGPAEQFAGISSEDRTPDASMEQFVALRKLYNDAGVNIHIVKFGNIGDSNMPEDEIHYYFNVAKALGARGITREISEGAAKRLGPIADEYGIKIGFHNHTQITPTTFEGPILSYGENMAINLDVGHYVAGTNESPIPFMEKYHDRILSLHIKDRKKDNGPNVPFGEGDTPVAEILQLMAQEKWDFPADIELEYPVPEGSDAITEIKKCVEFCKNALS